MQRPSPIEDQFLQVRRVIASIAYANDEIDEEERRLLATSIGGQYQVPEHQIHILLEDAIHKTRVEDIATQITDPQFVRFLIVDLMTLAIAKHNWEDSEVSAAKRAIDSLCLPQEVVTTVRQAFDLLRTANRDMQSAIDPH